MTTYYVTITYAITVGSQTETQTAILEIKATTITEAVLQGAVKGFSFCCGSENYACTGVSASTSQPV